MHTTNALPPRATRSKLCCVNEEVPELAVEFEAFFEDHLHHEVCQRTGPAMSMEQTPRGENLTLQTWVAKPAFRRNPWGLFESLTVYREAGQRWQRLSVF